MGHHDIVVFSGAAHPFVLFGAVGPEVHRGRVVPKKKRLPVFVAAVDEGGRMLSHLFIDGFHALFGEGPVSSMLCPPLPSAQLCNTPLGPYRLLNSGSFG